MNGPASDPASKRLIRESELAARKSQRSDLQFKLDHFIQTRQDTTSVTAELAEVDADIQRLEEELRIR
ncbi:hypothetical protein [uncultured Piscinibacter sp.]|uniref:hypothetical protein n=1 Tax=uncultured Piscinibacter sp. TaxID=1131835 RepID=UPI002604812A|nr:hypothetical protein [uncultured Piscinibacter sp.]